MKFTLKHKSIFNAPSHLPWHLSARAGVIGVTDYLNMRTYCVNMWGEPGVVWQLRGSTWYFAHEADAIQVLLTFS